MAEGKAPIPVDVKAGKAYYWCTCGLSKAQPFCDGAHKGSDKAPMAYTPEADGTIYFCTCKATANAPMCDGAHKSL